MPKERPLSHHYHSYLLNPNSSLDRPLAVFVTNLDSAYVAAPKPFRTIYAGGAVPCARGFISRQTGGGRSPLKTVRRALSGVVPFEAT